MTVAAASLLSEQVQRLGEFAFRVANGAISGITRFKALLFVDREREKMLQEMFWVNSPAMNLVTGEDYLEDAGVVATYGPHPHEELAMQALGAMCPLPSEHVQGDAFLANIGTGDAVACGGAPISNATSRRYLPYRLRKSWDVVEGGCELNPRLIPYQHVVGDKPFIYVNSAMKRGKDLKRHKEIAIVRESGRAELWQPSGPIWGADKWLLKDFLLVSKVPRTMAEGDAILVTGGHGSGTIAFRLLLDRRAFPDNEFMKLYDAVKKLKSRYFQFVLEVDELDHWGAVQVGAKEYRNVTLANRIRLCSLPPVKIDQTWELFLPWKGASLHSP